MNIHEYQGKALLKQHGVPVLEGVHCTTVDQALAAYDQLGSKVVAVKSQIHAGGRGKGNLYAPDSGDLVMEGGVNLQDIVTAINKVGASPGDLISVLEALQQAGALSAQIVVI